MSNSADDFGNIFKEHGIKVFYIKKIKNKDDGLSEYHILEGYLAFSASNKRNLYSVISNNDTMCGLSYGLNISLNLKKDIIKIDDTYIEVYISMYNSNNEDINNFDVICVEDIEGFKLILNKLNNICEECITNGDYYILNL